MAVPIAASAASYPTNQTITINEAAVPQGQNAIITVSGYLPNTPNITLILTGENADSFTQALVKMAVTSKSFGPVTANGSGQAVFSLTVPNNASGTYTTVAKAPNYADQSVSFTVAAVPNGGKGLPATDGLPATGVDAASMAGIWIGGGVLLLGGLVVTVVAARRKSSSQDR